MIRKGFDVIQRPSTSAIVAEQITEMIRSGVYSPGEKLPSQKELEEMMQISRPTLREAMARLAVLGIIEAHQGQGYFVLSNPDERKAADSQKEDDVFDANEGKLRQLLDARLNLEGTLARLACIHATDEEIQQLLDYVNIQEPSLIEKDEVGKEKRSFHEMVAKFAHNEFLENFEKNLLELFLRHEAAFISTDEPFLFDKYTFEPHKAIAEAIAARDTAKAYDESFRHVIKYTYDLSLKEKYKGLLSTIDQEDNT